MLTQRSIPCRRRGFSVVEVLVALVLVAIGLLGIAGGSALALRVMGNSARERAAGRRVADRVAWLSSVPCDRAAGGEVLGGDGSRERWSVLRDGEHLLVTDSLSWETASGPKLFTIASAVRC